jgi:hypothetical protein
MGPRFSPQRLQRRCQRPFPRPKQRTILQSHFQSLAIRPPGVQRLFLGTVTYFVWAGRVYHCHGLYRPILDLQPNDYLLHDARLTAEPPHGSGTHRLKQLPASNG